MQCVSSRWVWMHASIYVNSSMRILLFDRSPIGIYLQHFVSAPLCPILLGREG